MPRGSYDQPCSLAGALDRIGERWALLVVRELSLGPLRFSDLARRVGGAPTDVLTRRVRALEADGIVQRRLLGPPASAEVYELTEAGRELEGPLVELGRWGLRFFDPARVGEIGPSLLPSSLRILLRPSPEAALRIGLRSGQEEHSLEVCNGAVRASRGPARDPDLTLSGSPLSILAALTGLAPPAGAAAADASFGTAGAQGAGEEAEIEGDPAALEALRAMVELPAELRERLRGAAPGTPAAAPASPTARTS